MRGRGGSRSIRALRRMTLLFLALALMLPWIFLDTWFGWTAEEESQRVTVPDFCGAEYASLSFEEWQQVKVEYRYDADVPAGTVISQTPAAGSIKRLSSRRSSCSFLLTVSLGSEQVELKNVAGMDVREAVELLRADGFAVDTVMQTGPYPEGTVLSVSHAGRLPKGSRVTLTVSAGEPAVTVTVPNVVGLTRADALIRLWLCQLSVGSVIEEISAEEAGSVIRQSHQPGTVVMSGTKITLYVSMEE